MGGESKERGRTGSFIVIGIKPCNQARDDGHLDKEDDSMEKRLQW